MTFKAVVFDLDGTLLARIEDLGESVNSVLGRSGFPGHSMSDYKIFVGGGMYNLVKRSLPLQSGSELIGRTLKSLKIEYKKRCFLKTGAYPGIKEALNALKSNGIIL